MNDDLRKRLEAALDGIENLEHRVSIVIEGGRQQLSHLVSELKIMELKHELRSILKEMRQP